MTRPMMMQVDANVQLPVLRGLPAALTGLDRCLVMGVLNVTPDSFSDGGAFLGAEAAVAHGLAMVAEGADLVDVGGESTRPGAQRTDAEPETRRVLPVVRALTDAGVPVSIDTMRASTAAAAVDAGACLVNDVSGGLADEAMARTVADLGVPFVAMHWRGHSVDMDTRAVYDDVVAEVVTGLESRLAALTAQGLDIDHIVIDPGLGFAKQGLHNWSLLARLDALQALGRPVLLGASRKGFLGTLLADDSGDPRPADRRADATTALTAILAARGAWGVRVHDVAGSADAVRVVAALDAAGKATRHAAGNAARETARDVGRDVARGVRNPA
jgi:dihydropteroate synthase